MSYHDMFYHDMVNQNKDMYWYAMVQQCININKYHAVPPKPSLIGFINEHGGLLGVMGLNVEYKV